MAMMLPITINLSIFNLTNAYNLRRKNDTEIINVNVNTSEKEKVKHKLEIETQVCPNNNEYNTIFPLNLNLSIENDDKEPNIINNVNFKYYVFADYGCLYSEMIHTEPENVLLYVPLISSNITLKSQYIITYRQVGGYIDNSVFQIYNPNNILNIRDTFVSYINNEVLYLLPWVTALTNIFVNVNQTEKYTNIYIQKMSITRIAVVFSNFNNILNSNDIQNYINIMQTI